MNEYQDQAVWWEISYPLISRFAGALPVATFDTRDEAERYLSAHRDRLAWEWDVEPGRLTIVRRRGLA